jgi:hypothetical protein
LDELNPLDAELNPICHLLALLGARHILHVGVLRVKEKVRQWSFKEEALEALSGRTRFGRAKVL